MAVLATAGLTDDLQSRGKKYRELLREALDHCGDPALRQHWVARWLIDGEYPEGVLPRVLLSPWKTMRAIIRQPLLDWLSSQLGMKSAVDDNILLMPGITPAQGRALLDKLKPLGAARGGSRL